MKKFFLMFFVFFVMNENAFCARGNNSKSTTLRSSSKRSASSRSLSSARSSTTKTSSSESSSDNTDKFASCMDNICISEKFEDKGRCRCSSQLSRIEKILRDIEKIQNEADAQNKNLETLMNVSNTALVDDSISSVYNNINSIEKKSKTLASQKLDSKTLVMEGYPLYKKAYEECKSYLPSKKDDATKKENEYTILIETDCSAYTTILKEKADNAQNLLVQSQKNQEMFEEQQYKQLNQLDTSSCYTEYESCMKTQCGEDYAFCSESVKLEANLKKCQSINYGKCEENKVVVIKDLRKAIKKSHEKNAIAQACKSAMGHIENGQCLFTVRYVADSCTIAKKCNDSTEKVFLPGYTVTCDDTRGDFKDILAGCKESCYLIGPNGGTEDGYEKKIGTNVETGGKTVGKVFLAIGTFGLSTISSNAQPGCKADKDLDRYTLPIPAGWGKDGYPIDEELKNAF